MQFRSSRAPASGFFVQLDHWKTDAKKAGRDLIDLSVGASDMACPPEALDTLREATHDPSTYSYCLKNQTLPLLRAACDWYHRRYGIQFDPHTEALSLIGSQEGLAHLLLGVTEHGDSVIMCDVAYPSYFGALTVAGLRPVYLTLDQETGLPDLTKLTPEQLTRAKVLLLNYPNNPTTVTATNEFFQTAINFCLQHNLLLVHDNPYLDLVYEGQTPSPLALPGGKECCIELFSFAKSHHIAGFRLGFALGARDAVAALEAVKAPIDFNVYLGIQRMGITCLSLPEERVRADAQRWRSRARCMVEALQKHAGWSIRMPDSGMYLWSQLPANYHNHQPNGVTGATGPGCAQLPVGSSSDPGCMAGGEGEDVAFCQQLLAATGVALSPGTGFGPGGKGCVRFALVADEPRLEEAARRIGDWLRQRQ